MSSFFAQRRQHFMNNMLDNSAAIIFSAPEAKRSADTEYPYRQDSNFWYFTGFNESQAVLLFLKTEQSNVILFSQEKDPHIELWTGKRLGQQAAMTSLGVDEALPIQQLKAKLPELLNGLDALYYACDEYAYADRIMHDVLHTLRTERRKNYRVPMMSIDWRPLVHEMRLFKRDDELAIMERACEITALAHNKAMTCCQPNAYEYQLEAEILREFMMSGARSPSYNSIVGGGENACILHYTENNCLLKNGELVLVDAGCEYQGYAGDITRTYPINGKFTPAQREIYDIVLSSQLLALSLLKPGVSIYQVNQHVIRHMVEGLVAVGILHGEVDVLIEEKAYQQFYMHGLGHWLGLDVHDVGDYGTNNRTRLLEPRMVITVEPGLYIAKADNVPEKYWNIGIRIEDNIVITEKGNRVLTAKAVKDPDEIEKLMATKG